MQVEGELEDSDENSEEQASPYPYPSHTPLSHTPIYPQVFADRQEVPSGWYSSVGQDADDPVQLSATSHSSTAARQTPVLKLSGHEAADPVQYPASSQSVEERHVEEALADAKASSGHDADDPVQYSATSHSPAAERQRVDDGWYVSVEVSQQSPDVHSATGQSCQVIFPSFGKISHELKPGGQRKFTQIASPSATENEMEELAFASSQAATPSPLSPPGAET